AKSPPGIERSRSTEPRVWLLDERRDRCLDIARDGAEIRHIAVPVPSRNTPGPLGRPKHVAERSHGHGADVASDKIIRNQEWKPDIRVAARAVAPGVPDEQKHRQDAPFTS